MTTISVRAPRRRTFAVALPRLRRIAPLLLILALQSAVSLSLRNTAYQDEALYLFAGRQYFDYYFRGGPPPTEFYATYFSGLPQIYPLLAGALDVFGGLEAARFLNLASMLIATISVYFVAKSLFGRPSAVAAAALFSIQGSVLFLGRLATYDALSIAFVGLATLLCLRASTSRTPLPALALGVMLMAAAATKYVGLLFAPSILAILAIRTWQYHGRRQAIQRTGLAICTMVALVGGLLAVDPSLLAGLAFTTTQRVAFLSLSRPELFVRAVLLCGPLVVLGAIGLLINRTTSLLLALVLFGSSLLPSAYHIYSTEAVSMEKHVAFGMLFAAPLAGNALARLMAEQRGRFIGMRWLAGLAICVVLFGTGVERAHTFMTNWPDNSTLVHVLRTQMRGGVSRILVEESEVPRYYMQDMTYYWEWFNLYFFEYRDDPKGRGLHGVEAYKAAIDDGYFDLIVLRYGFSKKIAEEIDGGVRDGTHYELVAKVPYTTTSFGPGTYYVYRKRGGT